MRAWTLILAGKVTLTELETTYTLDDMLTLYALYMYTVDVERCRTEEMEKERKANSHSPHGGHAHGRYY